MAATTTGRCSMAPRAEHGIVEPGRGAGRPQPLRIRLGVGEAERIAQRPRCRPRALGGERDRRPRVQELRQPLGGREAGVGAAVGADTQRAGEAPAVEEGGAALAAHPLGVGRISGGGRPFVGDRHQSSRSQR